MPLMLLKAAAVAGALVAGGTAGHAELAGHAQSAQQQASVRVYIVRSGDTLSKIAGMFCGNPAKYPALASASGIGNPNIISVGQRIVLACSGGGSSTGSRASGGSSSRDHEPDGDSDDHNSNAVSVSGSNYAQGSAVVPGTSSVLSYAGLERIWMSAGGSSGTAYHAACIAEHESGGRPWAVSPTDDWGLWQIHGGGYAMLNAFANAQRAIAMSGNGTNWSQWTTAGMC